MEKLEKLRKATPEKKTRKLAVPTAKILPAAPPDGDNYTAALVESLCPYGTKVNKDYFNGRWQLYWRLVGPPVGPWRSISRSWSVRHNRECIVECLRVVWRARILETGAVCIVEDLFEDDGAVFL